MQEKLGLILAAFLIAFSAPQAHSQEEPERLAELPLEELMKVRVTSVASGTGKPLNEAPAVATVLSEADIDAMGATTLEKVLESVPGMHISHSGEIYQPKYLVRGLVSTRYNPETLLLVNGIPVSNLATGDTVRVGLLPIRMVARIEIIRGPGSALYGADAFSGVINVITKKPSELRGTQTGGGLESFGTYHAWLTHGEEVGELKVGLMADYRGTDGHKEVIVADAQTRLDQIFGTQASLAPGPVSLSEKALGLFLEIEKAKWKLRASYYGKGNIGEGQGRAQALSPEGRTSQARETVDLTYHDPKIGEFWDFTSQLAFQHYSYEVDKFLVLFPPGANLGMGVFPNGAIGRPEFWERQFRFDNSLVYSGIESHRLRLGAGYFFGHIYRVQNSKNSTPDFAPLPEIINVTDTSLIYLAENSRYSFYGYAQDEWRFAEDWELTAGFRYDRYSDFGGTLNPRAVLVWKTTPDLTTKLLYGRAFRAPTFTEFYNMNNLVAIGNPNLKPETIHVYEVAWAAQATRDWQIGLNLFHYRANNRIAFIRDPNGTTATAQNFGVQKGNGFGLETKLRASPELFVTGSYSFVKATNENSDRPAGDYPKNKVYLRGDWGIVSGWIWGTQLTWIGTRDREPADPRPPLKGYATVDLILRGKDVFQGFDVTASVRNVFDADVREPSEGPGPTAQAAAIPNDLPQAGRSGVVEVAYRF